MTSLEPTSRWAILPSGETLDFVRPGMSSVVGRNRGVLVPELLRVKLLNPLAGRAGACSVETYSRGLEGCVGAGVSLKATPTPSFVVAWLLGA
jgi:hypothetical protein